MKAQMILMLALLATAAGACGNGGPEDHSLDPQPVAVVAASEASAPQTWAAGVLEPFRRASPSTRLSGNVVAVHVEEGDRVEAGQLLVEMDSRDLRDQERSARIAVDAAERGLTEAERNLGRMQRLYDENLVARIKVEEAQLAVERAQAEFAATESRLEQVRVNLSYGLVRAPFDGVVVQRMVSEGDFAAPGRPLILLEDRRPLKLVARISDGTAERLAPGQTVRVRVRNRELELSGTVTAILPFGERAMPGFRVEVRVDDPPATLQPGASASVRVPSGDASEQPRVLVPETALVRRGQLRGVYVAQPADSAGDPARARLRWLVLAGEPAGPESAVVVLSGLDPGELVIVDPEPEGLRNGQPVTVRDRTLRTDTIGGQEES